MSRETTEALIRRMLTTMPPMFSARAAVRIALAHFDVRGSASPLVSERDQNFRLDASDGSRYVLKISNRAEREQVVDFQNRALMHIAGADPDLPVPRVIPARDGCLHITVDHLGESHHVRLFSWVEGRVLGEAAGSGLAGRLGRLLARMGLALSDFQHPGSDPSLLWDMKRAAGLRELLGGVEEPGLTYAIGEVLNRFDTRVTPLMGSLRTQVIYGDMNLDNVLVDEMDAQRISGLIDFGDLVTSPLVMDLAIAAAYQLSEGDDPLSGALPLIAGYHAVRPLHGVEQSLLGDLIRTRPVTSLLIGTYRAGLFPDNREYLLTSFAPARASLMALGRQAPGEITRRIEEVCADA